MFTVEMDHDEIAIVVVDDGANHEDVSVFLYDDLVVIRQWNKLLKNYDIINMSTSMFNEFQQALNLPEGAYVVR